MSDDFLRGLAFEIAQLRHAYKHLAAGRVVTKQREFADGLIAPAIQFLEGVYADASDQARVSDTHPKDGDVKQAPLVSGAVPKADAPASPSEPAQ